MVVKVSQETLAVLEKIITGDQLDSQGLGPYRSGPQLVSFFNSLGNSDTYGQGFPSRGSYTRTKIEYYNGTSRLKEVIEAALDPRRFLDSEFELDSTAAYLNKYLRLDGFVLRKVGDFYRVRKVTGSLVKVQSFILETGKPNHEFIQEQLAKCEQKITDGDFDGAITNARALLEAVLLELEQRLDPSASAHDGDLIKLYKRVQKHLGIDPARKDISDSLKQVARGLFSIVNGLSSMRNRMSDAHARSYKPQKHHARLAVNAAHTVVEFLFTTFEYQMSIGSISIQQ